MKIDFQKRKVVVVLFLVLFGAVGGSVSLAVDAKKKPQVAQEWESAKQQMAKLGKFHCSLEGVGKQAEKFWKPDLAWCMEARVDYLPVVFPGFSWHNKTPEAEMDAIPRQDGVFLWKQYAELKKLGIKMVYEAMFDEIDEGTQIYKVDNDPPVGASKFLTYPGLPSDHYLWLVGQANQMMLGKIPFAETLPKR